MTKSIPDAKPLFPTKNSRMLIIVIAVFALTTIAISIERIIKSKPNNKPTTHLIKDLSVPGLGTIAPADVSIDKDGRFWLRADAPVIGDYFNNPNKEYFNGKTVEVSRIGENHWIITAGTQLVNNSCPETGIWIRTETILPAQAPDTKPKTDSN